MVCLTQIKFGKLFTSASEASKSSVLGTGYLSQFDALFTVCFPHMQLLLSGLIIGTIGIAHSEWEIGSSIHSVTRSSSSFSTLSLIA